MKGDTNDDGKLSLMEQWEAERNKKSSKLKSAMYIRKGEKQKSVKQWKEEFNARGWGAKKVEKAAGINRWIEVYAAKCFTRYLNNVKLPGEENQAKMEKPEVHGRLKSDITENKEKIYERSYY